MISEKQLLANRQNALRSTGPRTAEGRAISSQNAIKHGLRAEQIVIMGENCEDYEQFYQELFQQLNPVGVLECRLAGQVAAALWKMQRLDRMESDLFRQMQDTEQKRRQDYAQQVLRAKERIDEAKSIYHGVMEAAQAAIHYVSFDEAQKAWFQTDDGRAWQENRWPTDHEYANPMLAFEAFWAELDQQAQSQLKPSPQPSPEPVDQPSSEPERTDLSYQVMLEQQQRRAQHLQNQQGDQESVDEPPESPQPDVTVSEPIPLGMAIKEDLSGPNVILKFSRYRTQSERSLYRALNELNKQQYLRKRSESIAVEPAEETERTAEC